MKFVDEYYVGFQKERYDTTDDQRILGFATAVTNNAAYLKRQETVNGWRDKNISTRIIKNVPLTGFKIVDTVSRYSTSNKFFRVLDPRGFELEISTENFLNVVKDSTIVKGLIVDEMLWGGDGAKPYLTSVNSDAYKQSLVKKPAEPNAKLEVGQYYSHKGANIIYRYEGKFYVNTLLILGERKDPHRSYGFYYRDHDNRTDYSSVTTELSTTINRHTKPMFVFSEFYVNSETGDVSRTTINIRKTNFVGLKLMGDDETVPSKVSASKFVPGLVEERVVSSIANWYMTQFSLFTDKTEQMNYAITDDEIWKLYMERSSHQPPKAYYGTVTYKTSYEEV